MTTLLVALAGIYAASEGMMRMAGRPRAVEVPKALGLLGMMVGATLVASALMGSGDAGVPGVLVFLLTVGVYAVGVLQGAHALRRARRQEDSQAHRLYMYLKAREVSESQQRRGEDGALADDDPGPFHLG